MCKEKNCMGGYDCCGCKARTTDNCITINKNLPNINALKGELLSATLLKIDDKFENPLTVTTVGASGATTLISGNLNVPRYDLGATTSVTILSDPTEDLEVVNRKAYYGITGVGGNLLRLPSIVENTGKEIIIVNKSGNSITIHSNDGIALDIWEQGTLTDEKIISIGSTTTVFNDGANWVVISEY